ncbi:hypothetical protein LIPSTDRAFT_68509 [Lipomyces starkeyi NRRL Y-11557]|uniref:Uncharacterized protein n=1 Tax=Lipomyces starkeyi NRRL Y-11557 TaxID=675824 RepID=A0A1E3QDT0_LIPST|nr:hypothetical protein LIPSTDRAFT_68509 [Lipomyces starkeyi NRRL Y-11557]
MSDFYITCSQPVCRADSCYRQIDANLNRQSTILVVITLLYWWFPHANAHQMQSEN